MQNKDRNRTDEYSSPGLKKKRQREVLEPSSTGYGLETALTDTEDKKKPQES